MPVFQYHAVDQKGKISNGMLAAEDEPKLEERLKALGLWLVDAAPHQPAAPTQAKRDSRAGTGWFTGIKRRDLIEFCTLMNFQLRSGVSMVQALEVCAQDCENDAFRKVLEEVRRHVESGSMLNEALGKFPRVFSPQFVCLIQTGEISSKLPETFADLREFLDWVDRLMADVRQASVYPAVVLVVISMFVLLLFTFVIPKFVDLLEVANVELPLITKIVFGASDFFKATWWAWIGLLLFGTVGLKLGRRYSRTFARTVDSLKLKLPVFGELNHMIAISAFSHNLGLLYRSGVPLLNSLALCQGLVGNVVVEEAIKDSHEKIEAGGLVSEALRRHEVFPSLLLRMVRMGETSGNLDVALENVSAYYNDVIPRRIKKIFSIMEPALMIFLVALVGTIALAVFLPILSLMSAIR
jgi:type II secretory pathway component PulF